MKEPIVAISAIEHHSYCPRQCALIHVDGIWADNPHTIRGHRAHKRVDNPNMSRVERGHQVLRSVPLWSEEHGLTGRADVIEIYPDGRVCPVEHKAGIQHGDAANLQLSAQAICLEEMLDIDISEGFVWYGGTRRRIRVSIDPQLRNKTIQAINEIRTYLCLGLLPVAPNDQRCVSCQLLHHCLPGVVTSPSTIMSYLRTELWGR